ncbi:sodium/hydrogen exchanger 2 [Ixodes scapularis]
MCSQLCYLMFFFFLQVVFGFLQGTVINAFTIGPSLYFLSNVGAIGLSDLDLLECLVFSSLISAVDPVAVSESSRSTCLVFFGAFFFFFLHAMSNSFPVRACVSRLPRGHCSSAKVLRKQTVRISHRLCSALLRSPMS